MVKTCFDPLSHEVSEVISNNSVFKKIHNVKGKSLVVEKEKN